METEKITLEESRFNIPVSESKSLHDQDTSIQFLGDDGSSLSSRSDQVLSLESDNPFGPKEPLTSWRKALVFLGICGCFFLQALDKTIVSTTLAAITKDFDDFANISWIGTAYMVASTVVLPIYGAASDMFGRKPVLFFATTVFLLGSALAGAARSMTMLIIGRSVQGLGGGGIHGVARILISDIFPRRQIAKYQGYSALTHVIALTIGPIFGGLMADHVSWRWVYYINFPIGLPSMTLLVLYLHVKRPETHTFRQGMATVDYSGIILLTISTIAILLALSWATDNKYSWGSATILSMLAGGAVAGLGFLFNEWTVVKQPILPLRLFRTASLAAGQLCTFIHGFVFLGLLFILPVYFQAVHGISAVQAGINLLPVLTLGSSTIIGTGWLMTKFNTSKEFVVAGFVIGTVSSGCLILLDKHSSRLIIIAQLIPLGLSMGLTANSNLMGIYAELDSHQDVALSTSLWAFLRSCGTTIGIAVASALLQNSLSAAGATEYTNNIQAMHILPLHVQEPVVHAFVEGTRRFFIVATVLWGVGLVATFFIQRLPLSKEESQASRN